MPNICKGHAVSSTVMSAHPSRTRTKYCITCPPRPRQNLHILSKWVRQGISNSLHRIRLISYWKPSICYMTITSLTWLVHGITTRSHQAEGTCPVSGRLCLLSNLVFALALPGSCSLQSSPPETFASHHSWLVSLELMQNLFQKSAKHRVFLTPPAAHACEISYHPHFLLLIVS